MRRFFVLFTLCIFIFEIGVVSTADAMAAHDVFKMEITETQERDGCHKIKQTESTKNAQNLSEECCDKGICKCIGSNCHGMSKIFGNDSNSLAVVSTDSLVFAFDNQFVESALANRLKRPPKA